MARNDLSFEQLSTILNSIVEQATGEQVLTATNEADFVSVAQTALKAGYDPLMTAISQVLSKTIFSIRPYNRKFKGIQVSNQRFGAITRKLQIVDDDWKNDVKFQLVDGQSVDHYTVNKPDVLQTNFYGANVFMDYITIYTEQLDNAFSGSAQFGEFISMIMTNMSNRIEQAHENLARRTIANFVAGKIRANNNVIHLLTEYNAKTGLSLTSTTLYQPSNFPAFVKWLHSRINTLTGLMENRTELYHINVTAMSDGGGGTLDKTIMRHSPKKMQKVYMLNEFLSEIEAMTLAETYHDNYLKLSDVEGVDFWQAIQSPMSLLSTPVYLQADGTLTSPLSPVAEDNLLGVIFDEEALGYTVIKHTVATTPLNAKGLYYNMFYHFTDRFWNDFTENGIVLLLD